MNEMLFYDAIMCLTEDPLLKDGFFDGVNASILIGSDSTETWRNNMLGEAVRLDVPLYHANRADIFCAYASPEAVISLIRGEASPSVMRVTELASTA